MKIVTIDFKPTNHPYLKVRNIVLMNKVLTKSWITSSYFVLYFEIKIMFSYNYFSANKKIHVQKKVKW